MANWKWFGRAHVALYKATNGKVGAKLGGIDVVLIHTVGRKSGHIRSVPIACYPYKDSVLVVASNNGQARNPLWWLNLKSHPEVEVQLGKEQFTVLAEELLGEEREAVWPGIIKINPRQKHYAKITERLLPVVYLKRKLA
jgi:deazaflavin-dependent oxidoreductase (nitroreductase family)